MQTYVSHINTKYGTLLKMLYRANQNERCPKQKFWCEHRTTFPYLIFIQISKFKNIKLYYILFSVFKRNSIKH